MSSGGSGGHPLGQGGSGGDGRVPGHALGEDHEQLAQQRGGGGAGLPVVELRHAGMDPDALAAAARRSACYVTGCATVRPA